MNILFVNACVRRESRTLGLARRVLELLPGHITELELDRESLEPLGRDLLTRREALLAAGNTQDPMFRYAHQFAQADTIVIAAPYWDLGFPALLKTYVERICVSGLTFRYVDGQPEGLCRGQKLIYVTTAGAHMFADFGYSYIRTLAHSFFGIPETRLVAAQGLDLEGAPVEELLDEAFLRYLSEGM